MKQKLILTAFMTIFLISNSSAAIEFEGGIQVNDSHIESGETVKMSVNADSNELIVGVDAKWNSWMDYESYDSCTGYSSCDASWTFTPYVTGERTLRVRARSESMSGYERDSRTITVHSQTSEERNVDFTTFPSTFTEDETHDITAEASDSLGNLYSERFVLEERRYYGTGLGWGTWNEVDSNYCWEVSGEECQVSGTFTPNSDGRFQLRASITASDGETLSTKETFSVQESVDNQQAVEITDLRNENSNIEYGESTDFEAEITANQDVDGFSSSFYVSGEPAATGTQSLDAGDTTTITATLTWDQLENIVETGQDHDLEFELTHYSFDEDISETVNDAFFLAEPEDDETPVEITNLQSTNTNIGEDEETEFEAEINANEDLNGLQVDFYVDGESL